MTTTPDRPPTLVIRPLSGWRALDLREVWAYRELLLIFAWRDVKVRYRQTFLGALWVIGQPLLGTLIFTFVFNRVARVESEPGIPYIVFVLGGLLIWNFFANSVGKAANSLIGSSYLISKIYFPRLIIPISGTLVELLDLGVAGLLLAALMVWHGVVPTAAIVLLPLVILLALVLATGLGLWLAALNVEYRDVRVLVPFALQLAMYATPVVYPLRLLPEKYRAIAFLNPMTGIVESFRACILGTAFPPAEALVSSIAFAVILLVTGLYYFRRVERLFADVL